MKELISVIVPVYNVEQYLDRCVSSIVAQTYNALEIILIDDGSTDSSTEKCDAWAEKDKRVRVIHQKNGGVSNARNTGLGKAVGQLVTFIDSDDFVEQDYLEVLYNCMNRTQSDIVVCNFFAEYADSNVIRTNHRMIQEEDTIDGCRQLYQDYVSKQAYTYVIWGKLYRKVILEGISFQKMHFAEDTLYLQQVFAKEPRTTLMTYQGYHYFVNTNSVTNDDTKLADRFMCELKAYWYTYEIVMEKGYETQITNNLYVLFNLLYRCTKCYLNKSLYLSKEEQKMFPKIMKRIVRRDPISSMTIKMILPIGLIVRSKIKQA